MGSLDEHYARLNRRDAATYGKSPQQIEEMDRKRVRVYLNGDILSKPVSRERAEKIVSRYAHKHPVGAFEIK